MRVSFYLKSKRKTVKVTPEIRDTEQAPAPAVKTDSRAIYARICYGGNELKFYVSESITPDLWDSDKQRAKQTKKFPIHPEFNARLDNIERDIKKIALQYANENGNKYPLPDTLRELLIKAFRNEKPKEKITFLSFLQKMIDRSNAGVRLSRAGKPLSENTIKSYGTFKSTFERYIKHTRSKVDFDTMDSRFYNDFKEYLITQEKFTTNTVGKRISILKIVLNEARREGIEVYDNFSSDFTGMSEEVDTIYLPEHELTAIANLDLKDAPHLDRVRDLFLIGCYTGLRFSDLSSLRPEHIKDGKITIVTQKTGKTVVIPVRSRVRDILNKYGGKLPKAISNQRTNEALKDIGKKVEILKSNVSVSKTKGGKLERSITPKYKLIATHTARRSFATNAYLDGVQPITIMAITGHKTETSFMRYIRVTSNEHAERMQQVYEEKENKQVKTIAI